MRFVNRFLSVIVLTLVCVNIADAGPLLNLIENRREARAVRNGACSPSTVTYSGSSSVRYTVTGGCVNGQCPIPQKVQPMPGFVPVQPKK